MHAAGPCLPVAPLRAGHAVRRRGRGAGFTLVEILVVLAILGLLAGVVALTLPDDRAALDRQADRFASHLLRAREEAIIGARSVRVSADADGYAFARLQSGQWTAIDGNAFAPRRWPDGIAPAIDPRAPRTSFAFDPTGAAEPQRLLLARGPDRVAVVLDAGGKVTRDARPR